MDKTVITIRIDRKTKKEAQALMAETGFTLSGVVNSYLKQIIATRHIDIIVPQKITPKTEKIIKRAEAETQAKETIGPFKTAEEAMKALQD